jgi:hypothetical protein
MGHITTLWLWTLDMAPDGDLSSFDEDDIEEGAEWIGEPGALVAALVVRKLLDETEYGLAIHDWEDTAAHLKAATRKRRERDKKRRQRAKHNNYTEVGDLSPNCPRDVPGTNGTVPGTNGTVPGTSQGQKRVSRRPTDQTDRPTDQTDQTRPTSTAGDTDGRIDLGRLGRHFSDRLGDLDEEPTARALLEELAPFSEADRAAIEGSDARTWLYAAKVVRSLRGRFEQPSKADRSSRDQQAEREAQRAAEEPQRWGSDAAAGLEQLAEAIGGKRGLE